MLLVFGPSNPGDTVGLVVDFLSGPINIWASNTERLEISLGRAGAHAIDKRMLNLEFLNKVEKSSLDYYAAIHSLHRQRRGNEISNDIVYTLTIDVWLNELSRTSGIRRRRTVAGKEKNAKKIGIGWGFS